MRAAAEDGVAGEDHRARRRPRPGSRPSRRCARAWAIAVIASAGGRHRPSARTGAPVSSTRPAAAPSTWSWCPWVTRIDTDRAVLGDPRAGGPRRAGPGRSRPPRLARRAQHPGVGAVERHRPRVGRAHQRHPARQPVEPATATPAMVRRHVPGRYRMCDAGHSVTDRAATPCRSAAWSARPRRSTSTSTGAPSGSSADADRAAGVPARPRRSTSPNSSEAPLITPGWPVKPGADATKPITLTTLTTLSRPTSASIAASALSAHAPGQVLGLLGGDLRADLAGGEQLAVDHRQLAGDVDVVAGLHGRHVGGQRRRHLGQRRGRARRASRSGAVRSRLLRPLHVRDQLLRVRARAPPRPAPSRPRPSCRGSAWSRGPAAARSTYSHFCMAQRLPLPIRRRRRRSGTLLTAALCQP